MKNPPPRTQMPTDTHHIACARCGATNRLSAERLGDDPDCGRCHQPLLDGQAVELTDANADRLLAGTTFPKYRNAPIKPSSPMLCASAATSIPMPT